MLTTAHMMVGERGDGGGGGGVGECLICCDRIVDRSRDWTNGDILKGEKEERGYAHQVLKHYVFSTMQGIIAT